MYQRVALCLFILAGLTFSSPVTVNLAGTVSDKSSKPIANAIVTLVKQNLKDTTGADGKYSFGGGVATYFQAVAPQTESISMNSGVVQLTLRKSSPVKVEIFDAKGTLIKKEVVQNAAAGVYHFNIAKNCMATSLLVVKAAIGDREESFRYMTLGSGKNTLNQPDAFLPSKGAGLAKLAAAVDTLMATAIGFKTKSLAITSYDNQKLDIALDSITGDAVTVQLTQEKQKIVGFGINATIVKSGANIPWNQLFTLEGSDALGLSILRIGMNETGGTRDVPSDYTKAKDLGAKIIGSCWSAPANWKTNNSVDQGGHLIASHYAEWAARIATFAKQYNLYAMSIANESDFASCASKGAPCTDDYPSMVYTAKEMAEFVKEARKAFKEKASNVKIIAPEASLWEHVWSTLSSTQKAAGYYNSSDPLGCGCFSNDINDAAELAKCKQSCLNGDGYDYGHWLAKDTASWNSFDILGVHEYEAQKAYPWPADVTGGKRTKEVWQTEMSGVKYWPEQGPSITIENGVAVARWIQSALTIGEASAWCYWWYEAYYQNDNEGLALIQGNSQKAKRYYAMGNYSRYMRPGQTVVNITGIDKLPAKVLLTASKGDDGTVVIVAVNETTSAQSVPINIAGGTVPASFKPYVTADGTKNCSEGSAVTVADGVLTMQLEKMSVTTFVGK
jgi:O-glycosyl hydrolase